MYYLCVFNSWVDYWFWCNVGETFVSGQSCLTSNFIQQPKHFNWVSKLGYKNKIKTKNTPIIVEKTTSDNAGGVL